MARQKFRKHLLLRVVDDDKNEFTEATGELFSVDFVVSIAYDSLVAEICT